MDLVEELAADILPGEVDEICVGVHWTAVVIQSNGKRRCGLASNPIKQAVPRDELLRLKAQSSPVELCLLANRHDSYLASIGMAAINASLPQILPREECNASELILRFGRGKHVALVGHFPFVEAIRDKVGRLSVLELYPQDGDLPASEAPNVIPRADLVAITSMTFINGTIEGLLRLCPPQTPVMVLGPSTPLSPRLFDKGIDFLCGAVVEAIEPVLESIRAGMRSQQFRHLGIRAVTIAKNWPDGPE